MQRLAVINVVGLTEDHIGKHTPNISRLIHDSVVKIVPPLPAVTCTVQSTMLTGATPREHGIVANGWHERETIDTSFWRQENDLVQAEKVWDALHAIDSNLMVANMFWWFNMHSSVDIAVTPRPVYLDNGGKIPDIWTSPSSLRSSLQKQFGQFPLFKFWGPNAGIESTKWIINATIEVEKRYTPALTLVYIPHLDYSMQRVGPRHPSIEQELRAVDGEVGRLIDHCNRKNINICILSEYGIEPVSDSVAINRVLREEGFLAVRKDMGREYLDPGSCKAFAVPDHQIAHVYVRHESDIESVATLLQTTPGIDAVLMGDQRGDLDHDRCGEIVIVSDADKWFSHDWWNSDTVAPHYQRTVDIHRKPGYDPRELLLAKGWRGSRARIALKLLWKKLGRWTPLDVITLDPTRVKGSHGRTPNMGAPSPILIPPTIAKKMPQSLPATALKNLIIEWIIS
ncbi:MAG: alkaline phosphatase family protein [Planctomycetota bacterium]|nr:alkaline phosphatase family protein [Planctomycetota bacterium]